MWLGTGRMEREKRVYVYVGGGRVCVEGSDCPDSWLLSPSARDRLYSGVSASRMAHVGISFWDCWLFSH